MTGFRDAAEQRHLAQLGGLGLAASRTSQERIDSARSAVQSRWAKSVSDPKRRATRARKVQKREGQFALWDAAFLRLTKS